MNLACPGRAACMTCLSPMRRCRQAISRPAAQTLKSATASMIARLAGRWPWSRIAACAVWHFRTAMMMLPCSDMTRRWPFATYVRNDAEVTPYVNRVFNPARWRADEPLRIVMIGTDFQVEVWEALLKVPMGAACRYGDLARDIGRDKASRAVGAAVGANPLSFVVPCHRAVGSSGALTGYHWGLTRKRAILGWEAGQVSRH